MKKFIVSLLLSALFPSILFAFSDVNQTNKYFTAISELTERGVIQGYEDNTFKPLRAINRAEFLKIVIEALNIELKEDTEITFPDVPEDAWYTKYVKTGLHFGWIQGYPDGTYKPSSNIKKVEALKILALAQEWNLEEINTEESPFEDTNKDAWYALYIKYAFDKNFLEEKQGEKYFPSNLMNRAQFSEIIFRNIITEESESDIFNESLIEPQQEEETTEEESNDEENETEEQEEDTDNQDENNQLLSTINKTFYPDTVLDENIPKNFYKNEVYYLNGTNTNDDDNVYVVIVEDNQIIQTFKGVITNNEFSVPVHFRNTGDFGISIVYSEFDILKLASISVESTVPKQGEDASTKVQDPEISFENNTTTLEWREPSNHTTFIEFNQDNLEVEFVFRQDTEQFEIPYKYFEGFKAEDTEVEFKTCKNTGTTTFSVSSNCQTNRDLEFEATYHHYSQLNSVANLQNLKETYNTGQDLEMSAVTLKDIQVRAAILTPNNEVIKPLIDGNSINGAIAENESFSFTLEDLEKGVYIFEINDTGGMATINTPIYVGNIIPLIPDYLDINSDSIQIEPTINTSEARARFLDLINQTRNQYGLDNVSLDTDLNTLATNHAEDMIQNDYVAHVNLQGQSPNDRRIEQGIETPVGENISFAANIEFSHFGLVRSPIHLKNIIDPRWEKVGLGFAQKDNGYLYTVQEFSHEPFNNSDLNDIEEYLLDEINELRDDNGLDPLESDSNYATAAENWSELMATEGFFGFVSESGTEIEEVLNDANVQGGVQVFISQGFNHFEFTNIISEQSVILDSEPSTLVGIGLRKNLTGELSLTIIFND